MTKAPLYVPVANRVFTENREEYLKRFDLLGSPHVVIYVERSFVPETNRQYLANLRQNLLFLSSHGYDATVWVQAFGFGNPLEGEEKLHASRFTRIRDLDGHVCGDAMCPTDPAFVAYYEDLIRGIAEAGAKRIMLDDDMCLSIRPGIGCTCERHMKLLSEKTGKSYSLDELKDNLFAGETNSFRKTWLVVMGESLKDFCRMVRAATDEVDPEIVIGCCAGYTSWDFEGADAGELTSILAGKYRPFLRLTGAPYWVEQNRFPGQHPAQIVEFTRMQRAWCEQSGIEIFTENDSYPRPRCRVPAALLETFDFCMSADHPIGQLKYLFDYYSRPGYEDGYLKAHLRNARLITRVREEIGPMPDAGIRVWEEKRKVAYMTFPEKPASAFETMYTAFSAAASMLSSCTLPVTYEQESKVIAAFGDSGRTVLLQKDKLYLIDLPAATELAKRGIDTGIVSMKPAASVPFTEYFIREEDAVLLDGCVRPSAIESRSVFFDCELHPSVKVKSIFNTPLGTYPATCTYENEEGYSFFILLFDAYAIRNNSAISCSRYRAEQIIDACRDAGAMLPAVCRGNPDFYLLVKRQGNKMAVVYCNFSLDAVYDAEIEIDGNYTHARYIGVEGTYRDRKMILPVVQPYGFGAVILEET